MTQDPKQYSPAPPHNSAPPPRDARRIWLMGIGVVAIAIAAFLAGLLLRGGGGHEAGQDHPAPAADAQAQVYTCPMHPEVRTSDPNERCPICGMELVPVTQEDDADEGPRTISLSPRAVALLNVQTAPVQRRQVTRPIRLFGRIDVDESQYRTISAWVDGRIDELYVDYCCAEIETGQPMMLLYSPELIAAQEELLQAQRLLAGFNDAVEDRVRRSAESARNVAREKLHLLGLTQQQVQNILSTGTVQNQVRIHAPVGGTVMERHVWQGTYVRAGDPLYQVADLSTVWVNLEAYESDLPWLREGQDVTITVPALPGETFTGRTDFIERELKDQTRTVRMRVELPNPDQSLKPNMFVSAVVQASPAPGPMLASTAQHDHLAVNQSQSPLVIPASAALITGRRAVVYVQHPNRDRPTFEGREVVLGPRAGQNLIVQSGLREGELVVTNGSFKLDAELQLRGRISMMAPEGNGEVGHEHHGHDHAAVAPADEPARPVDVPEQFANQIGAVIQANFDLVDALADNEPDRARSTARRARERLQAVDMQLVTGTARDSWMTMQRTMDRALESMIEAEGLDGIRRHFESFSDELTRAARTFGTGDAAPVYRATCPMVQGRQGYWLQPERPITNPYLGEPMYRCGEIAETLVE